MLTNIQRMYFQDVLGIACVYIYVKQNKYIWDKS